MPKVEWHFQIVLFVPCLSITYCTLFVFLSLVFMLVLVRQLRHRCWRYQKYSAALTWTLRAVFWLCYQTECTEQYRVLLGQTGLLMPRLQAPSRLSSRCSRHITPSPRPQLIKSFVSITVPTSLHQTLATGRDSVHTMTSPSWFAASTSHLPALP